MGMSFTLRLINIKPSTTDFGKTFGIPTCLKLKHAWPVMDFHYRPNCKNQN